MASSMKTKIMAVLMEEARRKKMGTKKQIVLLLPLVGMGLFLVLYVIAAHFYPGGSHSSPNAVGFSFWNNYLCDLLDTYAVNGMDNPAQLYSRIALLVLCSSLILLWYHLPKLFRSKSRNLTLMRFTGIAALVITLFMGVGNHDIVVRIAGVFGCIALISVFVELFRNRFYTLFAFGIFCLFIFLTNYYIYETEILINRLPVLQKFTFLSFIGWFTALDISIYKQVKSITAHY